MERPNGYQMAKAKKIADYLRDCAGDRMTAHQLSKCVAIMDSDQWRTVSFQAGVPVADLDAKVAVLAILRGKELHAV
jgi:hypothetical protein